MLFGLYFSFFPRKGLSGDIMNQACCDFIRNCSMANIKADSKCVGKF